MKHNKFASGGKTVFLAIVLSLGLSYVYAWTAPTERPPDGNTAAPINTSANAQTKTGTLSVTDIGINGNFIDTITTFPVPPSGGAGTLGDTTIIVGNNWPNFADVAGNAAKLAGLTSADILSADTTGTGGGVMQYVAYGATTCATGWVKAYDGILLNYYATNGMDVYGTQQNTVIGEHIICTGLERSPFNSGVTGPTYSSGRGYFGFGIHGTENSPSIQCAVCIK